MTDFEVTETDDAFRLEYVGVAPFPTARFKTFLSRLKVQSKDFGLVPFRLLGSQPHLPPQGGCAGLFEIDRRGVLRRAPAKIPDQLCSSQPQHAHPQKLI